MLGEIKGGGYEVERTFSITQSKGITNMKIITKN